MTERSVVILVSLAIVAAMAIVIYVVNRISAASPYIDGCAHLATITAAYELRQNIDQILENTKRIDRSLQDQRSVVNDAHKQISAVTKGVKKQAC